MPLAELLADSPLERQDVTNRVTGRRDLRRPIQCWRPTLTASLGPASISRDAARAMSQWQGERTVWLLPELTDGIRWFDDPQDPSSSVLALPAEHPERVDLFYIGENGYMAGSGSAVGWLDAFINTSDIVFYAGPKAIELEMPKLEGDTVTYQTARISCEPIGTMPMKVRSEPEGVIAEIGGKWPGQSASTVSIDAESLERFGPLEVEECGGVSVASNSRDPNFRSLYTVYCWPDEINGLFPRGSGGDVLLHHQRMIEVAQMSAHDVDGALRIARDSSGPYLSSGLAPLGHAWFAPTIEEVGEDQAILMGARIGLNDARTYEEALSSDLWAAKMREDIAVTRAWGPIGLLWALLIDELESSRMFVGCEHCGRILRSRSGKSFCSKSDDVKCFRERRASDQRRSRRRRNAASDEKI